MIRLEALAVAQHTPFQVPEKVPEICIFMFKVLQKTSPVPFIFITSCVPEAKLLPVMLYAPAVLYNKPSPLTSINLVDLVIPT